jgi:uncharacterized protein (TIGR02246 family)
MLLGMASDSPEALAKAFGVAMSAGDLDGALELWIEDATIVQPDGQAVQGRTAIAGALGAIVEHGVTVDIEIDRMFTAGDIALVVGTLTMSGAGADGERFSQTSDSTVIYTRNPEGQWRIAIDAPWGLPNS